MATKIPELKTLQDVIDYTTYYDIRKYSMIKNLETKSDVSYIDETKLDIYYDMIRSYIQRVKTQPQHRIYDRNPKLLSRDLYNTPDLDWLLIVLNRQSPSRFKIRRYINYIHPSDIDTVFDILSSK